MAIGFAITEDVETLCARLAEYAPTTLWVTKEALRRAREVQPSIVFLDIDMPRLDGIEACRRMKSEPSTADATIVMLTGDSEQGAELEARRAGADLFLTKPFSPLHLLRLVDRLADRPPQR